MASWETAMTPLLRDLGFKTEWLRDLADRGFGCNMDTSVYNRDGTLLRKRTAEELVDEITRFAKICGGCGGTLALMVHGTAGDEQIYYDLECWGH